MTTQWFRLLIILFIIFIFMGLLVWAMIKSRKQVIKDWEIIDALKKRANAAETKEEIEELHRDMLSFSLKVNNPFINAELMKIDGYLKGLYKQYKIKKDD